MRFRSGEVRYFTVYEAKLIQTFPKDFVILGAWGEALRQIGNAVPVRLGEKVGEALYSKIAASSNSPNQVVTAQNPSAAGKSSQTSLTPSETVCSQNVPCVLVEKAI